jgi:hypothetical protein
MSGRVYSLGIGIALVALAFLVTEAALGPRPGVTEVNARRIRPGMTMAEVEAVLGGPGDSRYGPCITFKGPHKPLWWRSPRLSRLPEAS